MKHFIIMRELPSETLPSENHPPPWKKIAEIPQESDFITWSIQNFVRKMKQFVKKYYIT